jgi:hypothetical protein
MSVLRHLLLLAAAAAAPLVACSSNDCVTDADCPDGRQCRVGLCSLGASGDATGSFADVTLDCATPAPGELVINEVLADPPAGSDADGNGAPSTSDDEFVELVNLAIRPVALTGVELVIGDKRTPLGARCLNPFESLVVFGSQGLPSLTNSGGSVALAQAGVEVQRVEWAAEGGRDSSLVLATELEADSPLTSHSEKYGEPFSPGTCGNGRAFPDCAATDPGTPPGPSECDPPGASDLVINELLADPPAGSDADGNGTPSTSDDEFVEVVNVATRAVAMNGVELWVGDRPVALGEGCLAPMGARVVFGSSGLPGLTNTGSVVTLRIGGAVVQTVTYGSEGGRDASLVRATELDPASAFVSHQDAFATAFSPGTCGNGRAFPDCGGPPVTPGGDATTGSDSAATSDVTSPTCSNRPVAGDLVINELLADPGTEGSPTACDANQDGAIGDADEFVELVNTSSQSLDLGGFKVTDASGKSVRVPDGTCLAPQQALLVFGKYNGGGSFGGAVVIGGTSSLSLNNSGDTVRVTSHEDALIAEAAYGSIANGDQSITRAIDLDATAAFVLHTARTTSGGSRMSPGLCASGAAFPDCGSGDVPPTDTSGSSDTASGPGPSCASPRAGELTINEFLRQPGNVDFNGDGVISSNHDEFVEVVNPSGVSLSLAGLELHDASSVRHAFAAICLPPGGAVVVFGGGSPVAGPTGVFVVRSSTGDLGFNDTGSETVTLKLSSGIVIDQVVGEPSGAARSWVRVPDCSLSSVSLHPVLGTRYASPGRRADGGFFDALSCRKP